MKNLKTWLFKIEFREPGTSANCRREMFKNLNRNHAKLEKCNTAIKHNSKLSAYATIRPSLYYESISLDPSTSRAVRRPRRTAAADNLWAPPPPTFVDRRAAAAAAADNLPARRRYHCCCVVIFCNFR